MKIGLDYDGTYTRDPSFWDKFILLAQEHGHDVICDTKREPECGVPGLSVPIVYSSRKAKNAAVAAAGHQVDVWIDDEPICIYAADGQRVLIG